MMNTNGRALNKWLRSLFFGVLFLGATTQAAFATVMLTNSRATVTTLGSQAFTVDWGALGGDFTALGSTLSNGPITVSGGSAFAVFNGSTYNADFNPDEYVLSLFDLNIGDTVSGVFSLNFASAVRAAGAQVQAFLVGAFAGTISAYDASNGLLGSFNVAGNNGGNGNGSAVFAGIISDSINITRLDFAFGSGAAINQVTANVPEPSTFLLMLGPLVFLFAARRRRIRG